MNNIHRLVQRVRDFADRSSAELSRMKSEALAEATHQYGDGLLSKDEFMAVARELMRLRL